MRAFIRGDLIEVSCMLVAIVVANLWVERYAAADSRPAVGFFTTILAALAGLLIGKWLQHRFDIQRRRHDD